MTPGPVPAVMFADGLRGSLDIQRNTGAPAAGESAGLDAEVWHAAC
jgi:hypothetical protein